MYVSVSSITDNSVTIFGSTADCLTGPCNSSAASPLPIELIYFEATQNENTIEFSWATASEINNDYFTIERSKKGEKWEAILEVNGAGTSSEIIEYFELDNSPKKGLMYYRLKQTDYDGEYTHSNIVPVNFKKPDKNIIVYPNPNDGVFFNIDLSGYENEEVIVVVRDISGKEMYSKVYFTSDNQTISIALENSLPKGTYLIVASSENELVSKKMIVE